MSILARLPLARRILIFMAGSAVAQGLAALTGLALAHWLSVADYALYTVMILITGAMTLLTKGGVHLGYTAILSRVWPDPARVDQAGKAMKRVRRLISAVVLPPIMLVSGFLLMDNGAGVSVTAIMLGLLLLNWLLDMQTRVVDQVLFFAKQTGRVQMLDTTLATARFGVVAVLYALGALNSVAAVAVTVLVAAIRVGPILRWIACVAPPTPIQPDPADVAAVRTTSLRQIPTELFTVFQTQIVLFILTLAAPVASVAAYGALTRIPQLLMPIQALSYSFCIPAFSQVKERGVLAGLAFYTGLCAAPAAVLVLLAWLMPSVLLLLVGQSYAHLQHELLIATANAALYNTASIFWSLVAHRGWNRFAWLQIAVGTSCCALAPAFLALDTLAGALWLQLGFTLGYLVSAVADLTAARHRGDYER